MWLEERIERAGVANPTSPLRRALAVGLALGVGLMSVSTSSRAQAPAEDVTAHVMARDDGDLVIDLSVKQGASTGDVVELWRPIQVKHPVTQRVFKDRFRIGSLRLTQVGNQLALAKPEGPLARKPQPGDVVILRRAPGPTRLKPVEKPQESEPPSSAPPKAAAEDPDARILSDLFESLRGTDPVVGIRAYEDYVRANPNGRYASVLYEEAQALRTLLERESSKVSAPTKPGARSFRAPEEALAGSPLSFGLEIEGEVVGAVIHVRSPGEVAFTSTPMTRAGESYFTIVVPTDRLRPPRLEYFIEATGPDGVAEPVAGHASSALSTRVHEVPRPVPPKKRDMTLSLVTDYANYNQGKNNDYAWQTEGYFGLRYDDVGVRALRSGFGVYRGAGGTLEDLDELGREARAIGLTYGYLEAEFGVSSFVSLIGRAVVGLRDEGTSGGGQALIRIGNDRKTNLMLGGEVLGGIGLRGITQLELNTFPRFPIVVRSEVTNQPAGVTDTNPRPVNESRPVSETSTGASDLGARGIVQVGYRFVPELTISVRGSYQGRTINHSGPGFGAGVMYQW